MIIQDQELNLKNAVSISQIGLDAIKNATSHLDIDLSSINKLDSSAVAVLLEWQRYAQFLNRSIAFTGVPLGLISLISVYGLSDFFKINSSQTS